MKPSLRLFILALSVITLQMQSQTFSNQTNLLNAVPGNSNQPCVVDMDGDGLDDVVRIFGNTIYIDYQQLNGTFNQTSYNTNMSNHASWSIAAGDIDGNGYTDLAIGSGNRASFLYANDDGSGFTEVLFDDFIFCQRSNFADIDNDGNLDAFICHDVDQSHPYRNDGQGNLTEDQTLIETAPFGGNYASIWVDYDNDNDLDLHIAKCRAGAVPSSPKRMNGLYRNNGDGTFTEVAAEVGLDDNDQSWVTVFEDFDNDGDFDAFTINHAWANILYENDGAGNFSNITTGSGINANDLGSWACIGADFDNDGFVDLLSESTTNQEFYHNNGDMTFTASPQSFDDGALCDLNNDGFIDVFTGYALWMNNGNDNNWVKFNLQGIISNSDAIGSKVEIYGAWGVQVRESRSGESFNPASTRNIHFGLGSATSIDSVVVHWPSGMVTTEYNPAINTQVNLIEAECLFDTSDIVALGSTTFCEGGSVTLEAPAGYSYNWSNNLGTNQTALITQSGNYHVVLTDNNTGCISISNDILATQIQPDQPVIQYEGANVSCASDPITLQAPEGISYLWNTGETSQNIQVNETGSYSVSVENQCNTMTSSDIVLQFNQTPNPIITSNTSIEEPGGTLVIEADGNDITWYADAEGTEVLGTGNTLNYDISEDQTIYVQNSGEFDGAMQSGGKLDFSGGGGIPSTGGGSTFNVWEDFTLLSVRVNALSSGDRTIYLVDNNGVTLESYTGFMDGEMTISLNWYIPVGNDYQILCAENNLFRNDSGVSYPYPIGDVGELYTSTFGGQYYYYFYNWQIQKGSMYCASDIVAVALDVVGIEEISQVDGINIYPNPITDYVRIELSINESVMLQYELFNSLGQSVLKKDLGKVQPGVVSEQIDLRNISSGTYNLILRSDNGVKNTQITKQ